jgi:hypothetical protein
MKEGEGTLDGVFRLRVGGMDRRPLESLAFEHDPRIYD